MAINDQDQGPAGNAGATAGIEDVRFHFDFDALTENL
jgi:hypothetical protein